MSEKLNYDRDRDKLDYQETDSNYRGDPFRDYSSVILEHIEDQQGEVEDAVGIPADEGAESAFSASQFEEEAVEGKSNQGGVGVDHTSEYPADEGAQSDYAARRFGWRSQSRRRQRGRKRVPPDTRGLHAPVFVPLADLSSAPAVKARTRRVRGPMKKTGLFAVKRAPSASSTL